MSSPAHGHEPQTEPTPSFPELRRHLGAIADIDQAMSLLGWDRETHMPPGAAEARARQLATLASVHHERLTSDHTLRLLEEAERSDPPADGEDAAFLRTARRAYEREAKLPGEFVEEFSRLRSTATGLWAEARRNDDFASFAPTLERVFEFTRRMADYLGFEEHPYDALHDLYEPGSRVARVRAVLNDLREATVPLVQAIREREDAVSDAPLRGTFDEREQERFGSDVVRAFGYSFEHGRLDRTVHPFAQGMSKWDVRITTRYNPEFLSPALFGTMHEAGHGMYEQGIADAYQRLPIGDSASLGIHESQSRLWENLVGRSRAFWTHAYPTLQERFPDAFRDVSLDAFHAAVNRVAPSFVRVEADEITYNLHIMVRFELELALLEGRLAVRDLPEAWNARYEEYLGITPPNDRLGCLQDIHWSAGLIGYFPTYTLGNIMSVQLFEAAQRAHPELEGEIARGQFGTLLAWLRENVHRHGSRYEPAQLLRRATGSDLDAAPYVRYLQTKFGGLYGLS